MKFIALISILLYIIGISSTNAGGNLAHLGGAFAGIVYALQLRRQSKNGKEGRRLFPGLNLFGAKPKVKISYKKPSSEIEYNRQKNQEKEQMNQILEKISKSGYDSLSKEEKEFLFKMGK